MIKSMATRILLARRAGRVMRFHTCDLIQRQTDGEHTFNVLNILAVLTNCKVGANLMKAALFHDMGELRMGDIPGNVKREMRDPAWMAIREMNAIQEIHPNYDTELEPEEYNLLKLADDLDGLITCTQEHVMGNTFIEEAGENYLLYVQDDLASCGDYLSEMAQQAVKIIMQDWSESYECAR